jgi:hypothetical protein
MVEDVLRRRALPCAAGSPRPTATWSVPVPRGRTRRRRRGDDAPSADLYVVNGEGDMLWAHTFAAWALCPIVCEIDGDGRNELMVTCGDGMVTRFATEGSA